MQISDGGGKAPGQPRERGVLVRRFTGESTGFDFPKSPIDLIERWGGSFGDRFSSTDLSRADQHLDSEFYVVPRFVYHIDEGAVAALTNYYKGAIRPGSDVLDICSSWVSHYPVTFKKDMRSVQASGMNKFELMANDQLSKGYTVVDLNRAGSKLP
ncbi:hypothetical protein TeGR_g10428 [Tetraparma gracilis]|uniref:Uncharacterized protein n=1 Tax=Tetraparma gracilis TaxID=2962635 RepID=A0ABQ6NB47_9STRA|nr:hypothetical protein TeGR_g10428 [Tetraparma gracilis]